MSYFSPPVIPSLPQFPWSFLLHPHPMQALRHSPLIISEEKLGVRGEDYRYFYSFGFFKTKPLHKRGRRQAQREYWRNIRRAGRDLRRTKLPSSPPPCPSKRSPRTGVQMGGLQGTEKMAEDVTKAKPFALREQGSAARCLCLSVVGRPSPEMLGSVS